MPHESNKSTGDSYKKGKGTRVGKGLLEKRNGFKAMGKLARGTVQVD